MSDLPSVAGFERLSLCDWPGHIVAVLFTNGCNMRCLWCHNFSLVYPPLFSPPLSAVEIEDFLDSIDPSLYDGVVVTGGEPLIHSGLPCLLEMIKRRGLKVRLDTNGSAPDLLKELLDAGLVDAVAIDYKLPLKLYGLVGWRDWKLIARSISLLAERRCGYVRTTLVPYLHDKKRLDTMKAELESITSGRLKWIHQPYQNPQGGRVIGRYQTAARNAS